MIKRSKIGNCKDNVHEPSHVNSANSDPDELICISDASSDYDCPAEFSISKLPNIEEEFQDFSEAPPIESDSDCYIQDEDTASQFVRKHLEESNHPPDADPNVCLMCVNGFPTQEELLNHNNQCHAASTLTFKCNTCALKLNSREALQKHMLLHPAVYKCTECDAIFQEESHFAKHLTQHRINKYQCLMCTEYFPTKNDLVMHKEQLGHDVLADFKCPVCDRKCNGRGSLGRHLRRHSKTHKCLFCKQTFPTNIDLQTHHNKHLGIKPFSCELCSQNFTKKGNLQRHTVVVHGPPARKKRQKRHISNVSSETEPTAATDKAPAIQNLCIKCNTVCGSEADLDDHYITFHKLHKCRLCDSSFHSSYQLKDHVNRHKGLKKVSCSVCKQKFASAGDRKKHMNIHADVMRLPHVCPHCDATFSLPSLLKIHTNAHLGIKPYKCDYCDKSFALRGALTVHMRTHPEYNPQLYKCELCHADFAHHIRLKKHYTLKHPERSNNSR